MLLTELGLELGLIKVMPIKGIKVGICFSKYALVVQFILSIVACFLVRYLQNDIYYLLCFT